MVLNCNLRGMETHTQKNNFIPLRMSVIILGNFVNTKNAEKG